MVHAQRAGSREAGPYDLLGEVGLAQTRRGLHRKRRWGLALTVLGIATLIGGATLLAVGMRDSCDLLYGSDLCDKELIKRWTGVALILGSANLIIGGAALAASGGRRIRELRRIYGSRVAWTPGLSLDPRGGFQLGLRHTF